MSNKTETQSYWWQCLPEVGDWAGEYARLADEAARKIERCKRELQSAEEWRGRIIKEAGTRAAECYSHDEMRLGVLGAYSNDLDELQCSEDFDEEDRACFAELFRIIFVVADVKAARRYFRNMDTALRDSLPANMAAVLRGAEPWEAQA